GGVDVDDHRRQQHHPHDPQEPRVRQGRGPELAQPLAVVVHGLGTQVQLEVPDHVEQHVGHQHDAGDGHRVLLAERRPVQVEQPQRRTAAALADRRSLGGGASGRALRARARRGRSGHVALLVPQPPGARDLRCGGAVPYARSLAARRFSPRIGRFAGGRRRRAHSTRSRRAHPRTELPVPDTSPTTAAGIPARTGYRPEGAPSASPEQYASALGDPGAFPFTRGVYGTMYRGRLWTMRQYAGFGSAKESNARYRYLLEHGQTGLSVAFDLPTQMGYDSDAELAVGEVGKVGVA